MAPVAEKEWTLMFYFASDTQLAPEIVSQLKALKQAGFHPDANVIAQFDPSLENTETHIFDVNRINKLRAEGGQESKIGFVGFTPNDPFVVNMMTDKLWRDDSKEGPIRKQVIDSLEDSLARKKKYAASNKKGPEGPKKFKFDPPVPPPSVTVKPAAAAASRNSNSNRTQFRDSSELSPRESLNSFLQFCSENYPARHYILFILGHGLVVGNDTFLFDEHAPEHFLHLRALREVLEAFKKSIKQQNAKAKFEMISLHSCSMSSTEVAFELQGIVDYMLASQSPSFVGSWPYRQILIQIFNYLEQNQTDVKGLLKNIFHYCLYNSYDFLVAGYSSDGCLCDLNKVGELKGPISDLSGQLIKGLTSKNTKLRQIVREHIVMAHLEAQSYFNENYTDQFDFCFRLQSRIELDRQKPAVLKAISKACQEVMEVLQKGVEGDDDRLIVRSEFVGPAYQYSHGLSVYFPWLRPMKSELERQFWPEEYQEYKFFKVLKNSRKSTWSDFLATYFEQTRRLTRMEEFAQAKKVPGSKNEGRPKGRARRLQANLLEAFATVVFNHDGQLQKPDPSSSQGDNCDCQSIKNYPAFTRQPEQPAAASGQDGNIPVSPTLAADDATFKPHSQRPSIVLDGLIE